MKHHFSSEKVHPQNNQILTLQSATTPGSDLVGQLRCHRCEQCLTPLKKFTKVIIPVENQVLGEEKPSEFEAEFVESEGTKIERGKEIDLQYSMLCVPCFVGWSIDEADLSTLKPQSSDYYVCGRTDLVHPQYRWTCNQLFWLLTLIQRFGPTIGKHFPSEFTKQSGSTRQIQELTVKYEELREDLFSQDILNFQLNSKNWKSEETGQGLHVISRKEIIEEISKDKNCEISSAKRFMSIINYDHPNDYKKLYPDNQADFMAQVLATTNLNPQQKYTGTFEESSDQNVSKGILPQILFQQIEAKGRMGKEISEYVLSMCNRYSKKDNRSAYSFRDQSGDDALLNLSHPELTKIKQIPVLENQLKRIIKIKEQRSQLFWDIKQRMKMSRSYLLDGIKSNSNKMVSEELIQVYSSEHPQDKQK